VKLPDRWLLVILGAHLLLAYLLFNPLPFTGGDNAHYMLLAESLGSGEAYRDLHLVGTPVHARYPPAYPAVLALVGVFGGGLITFKLLSVVFTTAALGFLFLLARRRLGRESALAVTAVMALNPLLLDYSHWVLSEAPFVCLTLAGLWALESVDDDNPRLWLALLAAALAFYTRTTGAVLLLTVLGFHALGLRWAHAGRGLAVTVVAVGAWVAWVARAVSGGATGYGSDFLRLDPYRPELGDIGIGGLLARILVNAREYASSELPQALGGGGWAPLAIVVAFGVLGLAIVAWWRGVRKAGAVELFVVLYAGLMLVWPPVWSDGRFLLPLLPLIVLLAFQTVPRGRGSAILAAVLLLLVIPALLPRISTTQSCRREMRQGDELACYDPVWRAFAVSARWVRSNTPDDAVIVNRKPRMFYLFANRRTAPFPLLATDAEKLAAFDRAGADYVVVSATIPGSDQYVVPLILSNPSHFERLFDTGEEPLTAHVLRYIP
jgi:4-amino-4-deoxy-L-arabinose transferase-like glycosyltransferase